MKMFTPNLLRCIVGKPTTKFIDKLLTTLTILVPNVIIVVFWFVFLCFFSNNFYFSNFCILRLILLNLNN